MGKRKSRLCRGCRKTKTTSITSLCIACRPADAIPAIHRDKEMLSFGGITLTENQAINFANAIIDSIETNRNTP